MKRMLFVAAVLAGFAVVAGTFGAHWLPNHLEGRVDPARSLKLQQTYEVGARYHMYHALALLVIAAMGLSGGLVTAAASLFVAGVVVFSGSLYLLAVTNIGWLGAVTPIGGVCFIIGWALLAAAAWRGGAVG